MWHIWSSLDLNCTRISKASDGTNGGTELDLKLRVLNKKKLPPNFPRNCLPPFLFLSVLQYFRSIRSHLACSMKSMLMDLFVQTPYSCECVFGLFGSGQFSMKCTKFDVICIYSFRHFPFHRTYFPA